MPRLLKQESLTLDRVWVLRLVGAVIHALGDTSAGLSHVTFPPYPLYFVTHLLEKESVGLELSLEI